MVSWRCPAEGRFVGESSPDGARCRPRPSWTALLQFRVAWQPSSAASLHVPPRSTATKAATARPGTLRTHPGTSGLPLSLERLPALPVLLWGELSAGQSLIEDLPGPA